MWTAETRRAARSCWSALYSRDEWEAIEPFTLLGTEFDNVSRDAQLLHGHGTSPALPDIAIQRSAAESTTRCSRP
jgi:hypothetical protein